MTDPLEHHKLLIREYSAILGPMELKIIHNPLKLNVKAFVYVFFLELSSIEFLKFSKGIVTSSNLHMKINTIEEN